MPPDSFSRAPEPLPAQPNPTRRWKMWLVVIGIGLVLLTGAGFAFVQLYGKTATPTATPTPSTAPAVTQSERSKLADSKLGPSQLTVTTLTADSADITTLLAKALQVSGGITVQGDITVSGNGTFGGNIHASNFIGSGAQLTGVNANLLNGQPGSYYASLASSASNAALRTAANTFTAANSFSVGLSSAGITDTGALTVSGTTNLAGSTTIASLILGSPLAVDSGGTGLASVPAASVLYGQGGPTLGVATPAGAGLCLLSGATDVQWGSCSGAVGVASLDGLAGVLTLANSTGSGATVTIDNATTAAKGIASFNATNFSVVAGAVNTIQNIATTSIPTFAGLTLTSALTVGSGGTGATSLTSNGVLLGNGASPVSSLVSGAAGNCLISTAGAPIWTTCPGSGGVTSVDSLTGVLTVANSTGLGSTITINNAAADGATKGIAAFNATNFSAASGVVNTIQNINTTASPTFTAVNTNTITPSAGLTLGATTQSFTLQGNASSSFTATNGANTTAVNFQSPTAAVSYRFATAAAGTYDICTTVGNCSGATGVTSLDTLTGALTVNNSSGFGSAITIDNAAADGTTKGIAAFNATNFQATSGVVDTIQGISTSATPTFAGQTLTGALLGTTATFTAAGSLTLGTASTNTGSAKFYNSGSANSLTLQSAAQTVGNAAITIPNVAGVNDTVCLLTLANCMGGAGGGANTALSNLVSTSINQSLIAGASNTLDLGSSGTAWRSGYFGTSIQAPLLDSISGALNIGTTNATVVNLNQSAVVGAGKSISITGGNTASRPGSPTEGMLYYDTTTKQLLTYSNGKWQSDRTTATKIVAASNASQAEKDGADYVATGTNDQTVINSALTAAAGGKVYLTEGTFTTTDAISIPNDTTLAGAGRGTLIQFGNIAGQTKNAITNTDTATGAGVVVRDLKVDGNRTVNTTGTMHGIYMDTVGSSSGNTAVPGAQVLNVWAINFHDNGVYITNSPNSTVSGVVAINNSQNGIVFNASSRGVITNNDVQGNGSRGISLSSEQNETVGNNTFVQNSTGGLQLNNTALSTVTGNNFRDNAGTGANDTILITNDSDNNLVTSNNISDTAGTGYAINISDAPSGSNYLADNYYTGTGATSMNDAGTGTIYANQSRATSGGQATFRNANDAAAFQIQNAAGTNLFAVDTSGNQVILGTTGSITGQVAFKGVTAASGVINLVGQANPTGTRTITLPDASGTVCLDSGNCLGGGSGGANTSLSNLVSTSINQGLIANASNTLDIGSSGTAWRSGYFGTSIQAPRLDSISGALVVGDANASSVTVGNTAATLTLQGNASTTLKATSGASTSTLQFSSPTGARTLTLPNASGTITLLSSGSSQNGISAFTQGGNTWAGAANLGTNDANTLNLRTNGVTVASLSSTGAALFQNASNSTTGFQIQNAAGNSAIVVDTTSAGVTDLVTNGSFETNTTGWTAKGSATLSSGSSDYVYGAKALQIAATALAGEGAKYPITLTDSTAYSLTFFVKASVSIATAFDFGYSSDGVTENTAGITSLNTSVGSTSGWTRATLSFTTPGTHSGTPYIFMKQTDASARNIFIDGVQLLQTTGISAYSEGNTQLNGLVTTPLILQAPANNTAALLVADSNGTSVLKVDTRNARVGINTASPTADLTFGINAGSGRTINVANAASGNNGDTLTLQSGNGNGTNKNGGGITLQGGAATGTGTGGDITLTGGTTTATGTNGSIRLTSGNTASATAGSIIAKAGIDSATAFQIQNSSSVALFTADTTNGQLIINGTNNGTELVIKANVSQTLNNPLIKLTSSTGTELARINGTTNGDFFAGASAGANFTSSTDANTGVGGSALLALTSGNANVAIGSQALQTVSTGSNNVAIGYVAGLQLQTIGADKGENNVAVGKGALGASTTSSGNVAIGWDAGVVAGSAANFYYNSFLGNAAGSTDGDSFATTSNLQNASAIGAFAQVQAANTIVLGSIGTDGNSQVVIGSTMPTSTNLFGVSPVFYNSRPAATAGTHKATQSGSTITDSTGTNFTTLGVKVGMRVIFADGTDGGTVTAIPTSSTLTVTSSQTVSPAQFYRIHDIGFQVKNDGTAYLQQTSATAFQLQDTSGTNLFTADTAGMVVKVSGTTGTFATLEINNAHFKSTQTTAPTIGTPTNCGGGTGPSAAVTASSTDSAGSFTLTAGSTGSPTTCDTVFTFNKAYGAAPKSIIVTAQGAATASARQIYVSASGTTTFTVKFGTNPANSEANTYYYWVVE